MTNKAFTPFIERKLERALGAICQIEDVCAYQYRKTSDADNLLQYEVILEVVNKPNIEIVFPIMTVAIQSSQWLTHQLLDACGWHKSEVPK